MENLRAGDLIIEIIEAAPPGPLQLMWRGKSNERHPGSVLQPFFAQVLAEAAAKQVAVEMHFQALDHFNSSTITVVIQLIQDARQRGVPLVLVYDPQLKWQKLSFEALRVFSKGDSLLQLRGS